MVCWLAVKKGPFFIIRPKSKVYFLRNLVQVQLDIKSIKTAQLNSCFYLLDYIVQQFVYYDLSTVNLLYSTPMLLQ